MVRISKFLVVPIKHTINLNDYVDTWKFSIQSLEMVKLGGNSYHNFILQEKVKATNKYPRKPIMLNPDYLIITQNF